MIAPTLASYLVPDPSDSRFTMDQLRLRLFHESQISRCESLLADYLKNITFWKDRLFASQTALARLGQPGDAR
jgi:hypothetical protein